jgi:hypothetical protein
VPVGKLPYGLQKRVELGRASPWSRTSAARRAMAGMNLEEKEDMSRFILDVNQQYGTTIALIEHDMGVVMDLSTGSWCSNTAARSPTGSRRGEARPARHRRLSRAWRTRDKQWLTQQQFPPASPPSTRARSASSACR